MKCISMSRCLKLVSADKAMYGILCPVLGYPVRERVELLERESSKGPQRWWTSWNTSSEERLRALRLFSLQERWLRGISSVCTNI